MLSLVVVLGLLCLSILTVILMFQQLHNEVMEQEEVEEHLGHMLDGYNPDHITCFECGERKDYRHFSKQRVDMLDPEDAVCCKCYKEGLGEPVESPYFERFKKGGEL